MRNLADENNNYANFRKVKNTHEYMRNDKGDSQLKFSSIMKGFENVQKEQLQEINTNKIIFLPDHTRLTKDGEKLLDSIQDETEKAYTLMVRMNYQAQLDVISKRDANERSKRLQEHIDKTMKMLKRKYPANLIKEYFQNHIKNLQFKI
jgi:predicted transcriptional regulator